MFLVTVVGIRIDVFSAKYINKEPCMYLELFYSQHSRAGQDSTAQHSTAQHSTAQHSTAQDRTGQQRKDIVARKGDSEANTIKDRRSNHIIRIEQEKTSSSARQATQERQSYKQRNTIQAGR